VRYSPEQLDSILRFIIGIVFALTVMGMVFFSLYSLVFVTQPMGESSENDRKFFELLTPIASFIVGALGGVLAASNNKTQKEEEKVE